MTQQREEIVGAVARGWCHPSNAYKTMDAELAYAIVDEVMKLKAAQAQAADRVADAGETMLDSTGSVVVDTWVAAEPVAWRKEAIK